MKNQKFTIGKKQADDFAMIFVGDIKQYIEAHQAEYAEFMRMEQSEFAEAQNG